MKMSEKKEFDPVEKIDKKKKNNKKNQISIKDSTDVLLLIVFIGLLILTIFLSVKVFSLHNEMKEHVRANIVIPVLEKATNNDVSIDLKNLKKGKTKEYIFKISNYRGDIINQDVLDYIVEVIPNKHVEVEIYKNNSKDAITLDDESQIKNNSLKEDEKQEDIFTVKIKALKDIKPKELLTIKITS